MPVVMATTVRRIKQEMRIRRSQSLAISKLLLHWLVQIIMGGASACSCSFFFRMEFFAISKESPHIPSIPHIPEYL